MSWIEILPPESASLHTLRNCFPAKPWIRFNTRAETFLGMLFTQLMLLNASFQPTPYSPMWPCWHFYEGFNY